MGSRKTLILIAAIAIGAIGAFILWGWLGGVQQRANGDAATVSVFVVRQQIPAGTYGQEVGSSIKEAKIQQQFVPPNAIRNPNQIKDRVAASNLLPNQIVTTDMFVDPAVAQTTFADRLKQIKDEDQVAVTISVDTVHGVAGLIQPGDYINVLVTNLCQNQGGAGSSALGSGVDPSTDLTKIFLFCQSRTLYEKVEVLAVDKRPVPSPGDVAAQTQTGASSASSNAIVNSGMLTLIVPTKAAQYITSTPAGNIYLELVNKDYKPSAQTPLDYKAPLPGEDPTIITPYGPAGPPVQK